MGIREANPSELPQSASTSVIETPVVTHRFSVESFTGNGFDRFGDLYSGGNVSLVTPAFDLTSKKLSFFLGGGVGGRGYWGRGPSPSSTPPTQEQKERGALEVLSSPTSLFDLYGRGTVYNLHGRWDTSIVLDLGLGLIFSRVTERKPSGDDYKRWFERGFPGSKAPLPPFAQPGVNNDVTEGRIDPVLTGRLGYAASYRIDREGNYRVMGGLSLEGILPLRGYWPGGGGLLGIVGFVWDGTKKGREIPVKKESPQIKKHKEPISVGAPPPEVKEPFSVKDLQIEPALILAGEKRPFKMLFSSNKPIAIILELIRSADADKPETDYSSDITVETLKSIPQGTGPWHEYACKGQLKGTLPAGKYKVILKFHDTSTTDPFSTMLIREVRLTIKTPPKVTEISIAPRDEGKGTPVYVANPATVNIKFDEIPPEAWQTLPKGEGIVTVTIGRAIRTGSVKAGSTEVTIPIWQKWGAFWTAGEGTHDVIVDTPWKKGIIAPFKVKIPGPPPKKTEQVPREIE